MIRRAGLLLTLLATFTLVACATEDPTEEEPTTRLRKRGTSANSDEGDGDGDGSGSSSSNTSPSGNSGSSSPTNPGGPGAQPRVGAVKQGVATFYDADGTGNCSFPASPQNLMVVAPNKGRLYDGSAACGSCMKVTGTKGSVVVRVVDSCPLDTPDNDCGDTDADLDLSAQAFALIEDPDVGMADVTFQVVSCDVSGPMQFRFKDGSSQWWTAVQVRNHREPVAKVEYKKDGAWIGMTREDDNYFIEPDGVGPRPQGLPLRITSIYGQVVEETLPIDDSKTLNGKNQFE